MAMTATAHRTKAEELAEQISGLRKGAPLYLSLAAEAQLHATLALVAQNAERSIAGLADELPKPPAVKAAGKRAASKLVDEIPAEVTA